ncbi:AraC family transcriptional regulator [Pseudoalteromonas sp. T1lg65]|uniref:AraC family transcriptional regulator n=1 Tax=Pseudoalteromonas sp. T1lg65 TaxID=2077101 RepID=UPI003F798409
MSKYQKRFIKVIDYIEANLDEKLDINKLCQFAHLSKYHFHRQSSAYFGIPIVSIIRLLRLKRAAFQLAYRNETRVTDIALQNGYQSHEAFSRAFKKHFAKSPVEFRKAPDWTPWLNIYDPITTLRKKIMNHHASFDVKLVDFPKTNIAVMEHRGAPHLLASTIQKFIDWRKRHRLPPSKSRTFNLLYDDPNVVTPDEFRFDLCCTLQSQLEDNADGVINKIIPAGKCAVIRHIGSDDAIGLAVNYLYCEWLAESDFEVRDFPIFLERVSFFPEVPEHEMITDIYLPIE